MLNSWQSRRSSSCTYALPWLPPGWVVVGPGRVVVGAGRVVVGPAVGVVVDVGLGPVGTVVEPRVEVGAGVHGGVVVRGAVVGVAGGRTGDGSAPWPKTTSLHQKYDWSEWA